MKYVRLNNLSLKYQRFRQSGFKDGLEILNLWKKTEFLHLILYFRPGYRFSKTARSGPYFGIKTCGTSASGGSRVT